DAGDRGEADSRLVRRARPGRDDHMRRPERLELRNADLVVAEHLHLGAELVEVLHQVPGEGIVVVDDGDHAHLPAAFRSARVLCFVPCHSESGSESATMPAAACTCSRASFSTAVRMAIATSMSPLKPR